MVCYRKNRARGQKEIQMKISADGTGIGWISSAAGKKIEFNEAGYGRCGALQIRREILRREERIECTVEITNVSDEPAVLPDLTVLHDESPEFDVPFADMKVFKLARQKNDVPGVFRPAQREDEAYQDALFDSSEIAAGMGVAEDGTQENAADIDGIEADPAMVFLGKKALFAGFAGQERHLCRVKLEIDHTAKKIHSFTATAELDARVLAPGEVFRCHDFVIETGTSLQELLKKHAERIAQTCGTRRLPFNNIYCTWYYYGHEIDRQEILENLEYISGKKLPFQVYQLDNGWHSGFGDWETDTEKFPGGMIEIADRIRAAGMIPGIWTAPFVLQPSSEALKRYPDLVLRDDRGEPCMFKTSYGNCYTLDPTAENAERFLTELFRRLTDWGYVYHKLDFLRAVFIHKEARFAGNTTRAEAYRRAMQIIRNAVGDKGFINACGGLFEASAGLVEVVRSGADLRGHWYGGKAGRIADYNMRMKQNIWRNFYNRLWSVDPDALQLRRNAVIWGSNPQAEHLSCADFTDTEAYSLIVNQFLGGGIYCVSERFKTFDRDREELLRFLLPLRNGVPEIIGSIDGYMPEIFYSRGEKHLLCICNWHGDEKKKYKVTSQMLPEGVGGKVTDLYSRTAAGEIAPGRDLEVELPPHGSVIYRIG